MNTLRKTLSTLVLAASVVVGAAGLSGCGGGGSAYQPAGTRTLGEELQDLQQSYEKGIITKKEYEDTKKKLMKRYTR
jgi:hypothetical protein